MNDVDILVTASLPPFLYEPLRADYRCHDYAETADGNALLRDVGVRVRGLVQGGGTVTPESLLEALPALEIISVFGVGYDGVPTAYCKRRGIQVTNTPDVLTDDVADVAVGLILMTGRGFVRANRFVRHGEWTKRGPELTTKLGGRTVGILGLGRIGKAIAERVIAMRMHVAYTGRRPQPVPVVVSPPPVRTPRDPSPATSPKRVAMPSVGRVISTSPRWFRRRSSQRSCRRRCLGRY